MLMSLWGAVCVGLLVSTRIATLVIPLLLSAGIGVCLGTNRVIITDADSHGARLAAHAPAHRDGGESRCRNLVHIRAWLTTCSTVSVQFVGVASHSVAYRATETYGPGSLNPSLSHDSIVELTPGLCEWRASQERRVAPILPPMWSRAESWWPIGEPLPIHTAVAGIIVGDQHRIIAVESTQTPVLSPAMSAEDFAKCNDGVHILLVAHVDSSCNRE